MIISSPPLVTLTGLLETLEPESAVGWFKQNEMIVNADKFRATVK